MTEHQGEVDASTHRYTGYTLKILLNKDGTFGHLATQAGKRNTALRHFQSVLERIFSITLIVLIVLYVRTLRN